MDFTNLESEETLSKALGMIAETMQDAFLQGATGVTFPFTPTENSTLIQVLEFTEKLKDALMMYNFRSWCVLDNVHKVVRMRVMMEGKE